MDQLHAWTLSPATQDLELSIRVRLNATERRATPSRYPDAQGSILGAFLDLIHRLIGMLAEHLDGRSMLRVERDTDTNGNSCFATRRQDWSADLRDEQAGLLSASCSPLTCCSKATYSSPPTLARRVGGTDATQETAGHGL